MFSNHLVNKSCSGKDSAIGLTQAGHLMVQLPHPNHILQIAFFTFCLLLMIRPFPPLKTEGKQHSSKYRNYSRVPNATSLFSMNAVRHLKNRSHGPQEFSVLCRLLAIAVWLSLGIAPLRRSLSSNLGTNCQLPKVMER